MRYTESPLFIGDNGVYGVITEPDSIESTLLIVTGFGEEKKSAYRNVVDICRHSAQNGIASLRFDLRGTGDSDFEFGNLRLSDWHDDIRLAYDHLVKRFPGTKLHLAAVRLGCLLAMDAQINADSIILVAPPMSGRQYLKEELLRKQLRAAMSGLPRVGVTEVESVLREKGCADLDGIVFPVALYDELSGLSYSTNAANELAVSVIYFANKPEPPSDVLALGERISLQTKFYGIASPSFWNTTDYLPVLQLGEIVTAICTKERLL